MRRGLLVLVCLIALSGLSGAKSTREELGLRGPVKEVVQPVSLTDNYVKVRKIFSREGLVEWSSQPFREGYEEYYLPYGKSGIFYDKKGRILNQDGLEFHYDFINRSFEAINDQGIKIHWGDLDDLGNIISWWGYKEETTKGKLQRVFEYDNHGRIIKVETYRLNRSNRVLWEYDEFGRRKNQTNEYEESSSYGRDKIERLWFVYDDNGWLNDIYEVSFSVEYKNVHQKWHRFEYSDLDSYGNWRTAKVYRWGELVATMTRTITYYE